VSGEPRQASLRRLRSFGVRPNRELGQNFLIDDNLLDVIGSAAELHRRDVVLEVGGGLGVLSEYLAARVRHLHVVEVDSTLSAPLEEALAPFSNTTVLLKSVEELPGARTWVAMAQREVAERLAAGPGTKTYGATSVLAQLSCEVRFLRRVPRTVFHPEPNVESALLLMRRHAPTPEPAVRALVHAGFAHRRKALSGSLALTPGAPEGLRDSVRAALEELGHPADARAERLPPSDWQRLAELVGPELIATLRPR
jgi:16S rRNA (adenine1518-N6/adenine1519-N6)-dimethyltransferase